MTTEPPTSIRIPQETLDRADALIEVADRLPEFAVTKPTRAAVLKLAMLRGLDVLEREAKKARR